MGWLGPPSFSYPKASPLMAPRWDHLFLIAVKQIVHAWHSFSREGLSEISSGCKMADLEAFQNKDLTVLKGKRKVEMSTEIARKKSKMEARVCESSLIEFLWIL